LISSSISSRESRSIFSKKIIVDDDYKRSRDEKLRWSGKSYGENANEQEDVDNELELETPSSILHASSSTNLSLHTT